MSIRKKVFILPLLMFIIIASGCWRLQPTPDYEDYYPRNQNQNVPQQPEPQTTPAQQQTDTQQNTPKTQQVTPTQPQQNDTPQQTTGMAETGKASYYADKFHGRATASGELYDKEKLTGSHRTLPFGTLVRVTNLANGKSVNVRINDRGPHANNRIIDLSYKAMSMIDGIRSGIINVKVEVLK